MEERVLRQQNTDVKRHRSKQRAMHSEICKQLLTLSPGIEKWKMYGLGQM
jgi:hypothetical protein